MRTKAYILLGLLMLLHTAYSQNSQYGKAVITNQLNYEDDNFYFPHDDFVIEDVGPFLDKAVSINRLNNQMIIKNKFDNGLSGHVVEFTISPSLEIMKVSYDEWISLPDGSKNTFKVEKVILSLSTNPFKNKLVSGFYILQIRVDEKVGLYQYKLGNRDTTFYKVFEGKFKIYTEQEKKNGKEWVIDQNQIMMGIKDSLGVYTFPDEFAQYKCGIDSLNSLLSQYAVNRSEIIKSKRKGYILISMIVDENGIVNPESVYMPDDTLKSTDLIDRFKKDVNLTTNWYPAKYKGRPVKTRYILAIQIKK